MSSTVETIGTQPLISMINVESRERHGTQTSSDRASDIIIHSPNALAVAATE